MIKYKSVVFLSFCFKSKIVAADIDVTSILTSDFFSPKQNDYQNKGNFDHFFRTQQKPGNIFFTKAFSQLQPNREFFNIHQNNWSAELILNKDDVNASNILVKKKAIGFMTPQVKYHSLICIQIKQC